jgi:hypothetical protein
MNLACPWIANHLFNFAQSHIDWILTTNATIVNCSAQKKRSISRDVTLIWGDTI